MSTFGTGADLDGKRVVIFGGGGDGIGRAVTETVARHGARLVVIGRNLERTKQSIAEINGISSRVTALIGDVTDPNDVDRLISDSVTAMGGLEVIITVVGGHQLFAPRATVDDTSDSDWDLIFDVNLRYVFRVTRAGLKVLLRQGHGGSIVCVGSIAGLTGMPLASPYAAAKAGLINFARTVAAEFGKSNIRMNVVSCGQIDTRVAQEAGVTNEMVRRVPMGRAGLPKEVAEAVLFFASDRSSYITGQSLAVDGGATVHFPLAAIGADEGMAG